MQLPKRVPWRSYSQPVSCLWLITKEPPEKKLVEVSVGTCYVLVLPGGCCWNHKLEMPHMLQEPGTAEAVLPVLQEPV